MTQREQLTKLILQSAAEGIYGVDVEGRCTFCNPACLRILGYDSENDLLGKNMHELIHYADRHGNACPVAECRIYQAYRQGDCVHVDQEVFWRRGGSSFPVEYWSYPVKDGAKIIGAVVSFFDISERLAAEAESRLKSRMLELSNDAILVWQVDGGISYWNHGAERIYGYRSDEALGRQPHQLLNTQNPIPWDDIESELRTKGEWSGRLQHTNKAGQQVTVSNRLQLVESPVGDEVILEVNRDITDQIRSESRLIKTQDELRVWERAIAFANDGILITDPQQADNPIVYVNQGFTDITGYTAEEVLGKNCRLLQGPDTDPALVQKLREAIAGEKECRCLIQNYHKDQTPFWNDLRIAPVRDEAGGVTHFVGIQSDATQRVETEQELRKAEQAAAAANEAKSQFLANMSHEIRTPMTSVIGLTDLLLSTTVDSDAAAMLRMIKQSGQHLLGLLNDILDLSKIEAGKLEVECEECSLFQIVNDVMALMQNRVEEKGIQLESEYIGRIPATIRTDEIRLRQILINLLGNAIKFTDEGHVRLTVRFVEDATTPMMEFQIADTGVGMTRQQIDKLFKPFAQLDSSASRRHRGTGLGLCISRELAAKLKGQIQVESEPGKGSTFRVTVSAGAMDAANLIDPQAAEEPAHQPVDENVGLPWLKANILVAEDTAGVQFLIRRFLETAGADVTIACTGKQALDAVNSEDTAFDLILMDMHMPEMTGYDATRRLRAANCTLPIIALTASAMRGDREKCLEAGCDDYLPKPIDRVALIQMVARFAGRNSQ